jgi:hypothetical protein
MSRTVAEGGQVFPEHYIPRWNDLSDVPSGWFAKAAPDLE